MKMKPILFSTPMVQAILEGRKTMTRRVVKARYDRERQRFARMGMFANISLRNGMWHGLSPEGIPFVNDEIEQPRFRTGDILWVRETWCRLWDLDRNDQIIEGTDHYYYAADGYNPTPYNHFPDEDGFSGDRCGPRWNPSIHMPREAARLFLRVTDVRAERVQGIIQEDMIREGAWAGCVDCFKHGGCYLPNACGYIREAWRDLWDGINAKRAGGVYAWDKNPWVWVYGFERISKEEAESEAA